MRLLRTHYCTGLACITILAPLLYQRSGGAAESLLMMAVTALGVMATICIYQSFKAVQSGRGRGRELEGFGVFSLWTAGLWVSLFGGLISLIPLPIWFMETLSSQTAEIWQTTKAFLNGVEINKTVSPMSLSPAHTWRWCSLQLTFLICAYVASLSRGNRERLIWALMIVGPLVCLLGVAHAILGLELPYGYFQTYDRHLLTGWVTPVVNANHQASLLNLSLFTTMGYLKTLKNVRLQRCLYLMIMISIFGLIQTSSRAGLGIALSLVAVWKLNAVVKWQTVLKALGGVIVGWWLLPWGLTLTVWSNIQPLPDDEVVKFYVWRDSLSLIADHPLWGIGRGAFGEVFTHYQRFKAEGWISQPEQHFLLSWGEGGVLGIFGGVLLPLVAGCVWWRSSRLSRHHIAQGIGLGVTAVALQQCFDFGLERLAVAIPFGVAWGVMWSYHSTVHFHIAEQAPKEVASRLRSHCYSLGIALIALLGLISKHAEYQHLQLRSLVQEGEQRESGITDQELVWHPHSAHLCMQRVHSLASHQEKHSRWTRLCRSLAPRWSGPHLYQAREYADLGMDELAAQSYRRALIDSERRQVIFKDLLVRPLNVRVFSWLPPQYWIAWYKWLSEAEPQKASLLLRGGTIDELLRSSDYRALWLQHVGVQCPLGRLKMLASALDQSKAKGEIRLVDEHLLKRLIGVCEGKLKKSMVVREEANGRFELAVGDELPIQQVKQNKERIKMWVKVISKASIK